MAGRMRCAALALGALAFSVGSAGAATYSFTDTGNASGTYDSTTGIVTLTALFSNPGDVADTISDVSLKFDSAVGSPTLTSQSAPDGLINFAKSGGGHVTTSGPSSGTPVNWTLSSTGSLVLLDTNHSRPGGGAPEDLIVGTGANGSTTDYSDGNPSLATHSPFIYHVGSFDIDGLSSTLALLSIQFSYGTKPTFSDWITPSCTGTDCRGNGPPPATTPLPAAVWLFGSVLGGAGGIGALRRRKKRRAAA